MLFLVFVPLLAFILTIGFFKGKTALVYPAVFWSMTLLGAGMMALRQKHKIYVQLNEEELTIKWRPKKLKHDRRYNSKDIDQLYVSKGMEHYDIKMIINTDVGQKHVRLISNIQSISKVKFLEQEFEKHLGIKNRKVPEEIS